MRPQKIDCIDLNPYVCKNATCDLQVVSRQEVTINVGCHLMRSFNEISFMGLMYNKQGMAYKKFGPEFKGNFCEALANRKNIVMESIFKQIGRRNSHIIHPCPFFGDHYVRNLTVDNAFGLNILPPGDYRFEVRLSETTTNITMLHTRIYFVIKATDPLKDMKGAFDWKISA